MSWFNDECPKYLLLIHSRLAMISTSIHFLGIFAFFNWVFDLWNRLICRSVSGFVAYKIILQYHKCCLEASHLGGCIYNLLQPPLTEPAECWCQFRSVIWSILSLISGKLPKNRHQSHTTRLQSIEQSNCTGDRDYRKTAGGLGCQTRPQNI